MMRIVPYICVIGLLAFAVITNFAAQRVTDFQGTNSISFADADSTGWSEGMDRVSIVNETTGETYDQLRGYFYFGEFSDSAGDTSLGGVDTAIVYVLTGTAYDQDTILMDSCAGLPCTLFFDYFQGMTDAADTSGAGVLLYETSRYDGLMLDLLWFQYRVADTNASAKTLSGSMNYWIRAYDKE